MCHCFHFFPSICHEVMGPDAMISVFFILSFKLAFSLSFTLIKRFCSCSLLYVIRMVSSTHLRLLIFLLAILIPACNSSSPTFHMMCSEYQLNKHSDNKLSSLNLIKRLFSSSLLSAIKVVSFAYLRLLIFLLEILIPAYDSFSLAFYMMYSGLPW